MAGDARLTPLGAMVLALLAEGDMHPYEMMRLLRDRHKDRIVRLTNGTFYHTVGRLERDGLIVEAGVDREGNRPERTTYALAPAAPAVLQDWVRAGLGRTDRTAEFRVALAEAHNLARAEVVELLGVRCAALRIELDTLHETLSTARAERVPDQFLIEADRHTALLDAEVAWTAGLLGRLSDPGFDWVGDQVRSLRTAGSSQASGCEASDSSESSTAASAAQRKASRR